MFTINEEKERGSIVSVLGLARGGTTITAKLIESLGVDMGNHHHTGTTEDTFFRSHGGDRSLFNSSKYLTEYTSKAAKYINNCNKGSLIGWKDPLSSYYISELYPLIGVSSHVVVTRDTTAITHGEMRFINRKNLFDWTDKHTLGTMKFHIDEMNLILNFIHHYSPRVIFISYEKLLLKPLATITELNKFLKTDRSVTELEKIVEIIKPNENSLSPSAK